MTNLTEKWKKGELPEEWYYIKLIPDFEYTDDIVFYTGECFHFYSGEDIEQVLAPVPSYEEWKKAYECVVSENEEITTLKELLKECKHIMSIEKDFASCHFEKDKLCKLLTKINQVL